MDTNDSISVYGTNPDVKATPNYVVKNGTTLTNSSNETVTIPTNAFAKSATADLKGINNVYYANPAGDGYICDNAVIEDQVDFYCPELITAGKLSYNRVFSSSESDQKYNSVCLPFILNAEDFDGELCRYDRETPTQFWFTKVSSYVPANIPVLLKLNKGGKLFENLENITIAKTEKQVVVDDAYDQDMSKAYGTFKKVNAGEFKGEAEAYKIYGLNGMKFVPAKFAADGTTTASFAAFRMGISSELVNVGSFDGSVMDAREIVIVDENGNIISGSGSSAVESVKSDDTSLQVVGGQSEIVITSDADYGKVQVYNLNGGVVAIADVMAGTTSVNVEKGIYIVLGKKVMVK